MASNHFDKYDAADSAETPSANHFDQYDEKPKPPDRGFKGWAQDVAATAVKGAIGVPEALVGLADIPTGGAVGKFLENEGGAVGFRPKQAKEIANQWHSDATLEAQRKVQEAQGFGGKLQAAIENPSVIATAIGESLPAMGAGGVAARGLIAATRLGQMGAGGAALAGAIGEGVTGAGSAAEQIRQETPDGLLTPEQAALAGATGLATTAFGAAGGKLATKLGIGDAETMLAQGAKGIGSEAAQQSALKSVPKAVIQGAISEGLLEELPQSVAEQVLQNLALGKDWTDGVDEAAVMGVLSGGAMGGGAAGLHGAMSARKQTSTPAPADQPAQDPSQPPANQPLGSSLTGTNPADLMSRSADPLAGQISADRLQAEDAAVTRNDFADRNGAMLTGSGLEGSRADPLANMLADNRTSEANTAANIQRAAEKRGPMTATTAANILVASQQQGLEFTVAPHPDGGFLVVPRSWVSPSVAAQSEASLRETLSRVAKVEDAPIQRAARVSTDPVNLDLNTDPVTGYVDNLRAVNTPAAKAFVGEFDAGRLTRQDVEQRMAADRGKTPDERLAEAAAQASTPQEPYSLTAVKPSQSMGLNPAAGPMSSAAVIAVDSGAHGAVRAAQAAAEPTPTTGEPANGPTPAQAVTKESGRQTEKQDALSSGVVLHPSSTEVVGTKSLGNSSSADSKRLSNLASSEALLKKWLDGIDAEADASVKRHMLRVSQDPKIFNSVVELIPVDVMNMLGRLKLTPEMIFNNPSVLKSNGVRGNGDNSVAIPIDAAAAIMRAVALGAAENLSVDKLPHSGGLSVRGDATNDAFVPSSIDVVGGLPGHGGGLVRGAAGPAAKNVGGSDDLGLVPSDKKAALDARNSKHRGNPFAGLNGNVSEAVQAAPQGPAQPAPAAQPTAWDGLSPAQRGEVAARAGLPKILAANIPSAAWDQINPKTRAKLEAAMVQPAAPTADVKATQPATAATSAAVEPQAAGHAGVPGADQPGAVQALSNVTSLTDRLRDKIRDSALEKATRQEIESQLSELSKLGQQNRVTMGDLERLQEITATNTNGYNASRDLHQLLKGIRTRAAGNIQTETPANVQDAPQAANDAKAAAAPGEARAPEGGNAAAAGGVPAATGAGDVQADGVKAEAIADAAHQAATSPKNDLPQPTEAQKEAGNYQKGHARIAGHDITIENPAGSKRRPEWPALKNHYGYFKGSVGADKDHVDVFMTDRAGDESLPVFVVDQVNKDGSFDEHKVVMGAADEAEARATYLQNYKKGWTGLAAITQMSQDDFKAWVRDPAKTKKPAGKIQAKADSPRGVLAKMADQKRQAALDRIAKGTAYFGTKEKADDFITKSGIGDTHEVVSAKPGRFEIRAKEAAVPASVSQPNPEKKPEASTAAAPASQKEPAEPPKRKALLLRAVGQKMAEQGAADQSRDRNTNTARRASMAASADADARKREAMGKTLVNLADAIESGAATKLAGITTKAQVEALEKALVRGMVESERGLSYVDQQRQKGRAPTEQDVRNARFPKLSWSNGGADSARLLEAIKGKKGSKEVADMLRFGPPRAEQLASLKKLGVPDSVLQSGFGWWNIEMMAEVGRLERAGIKTDEDLRGAIAEYIEYRDGPKKEDPIKAAERKLIGQKVGLDFFPTPKAVADRMVQAAGIKAGMRVLEPSAGNGNLADAAKAAGAEVDAVEVSDALREVLSAKGYELAGRDFLSFEPTEKYDAIIMNPPFSNRLDAEHIQRAFGMLKPGGRLVAIAGEGIFNGVDKKAQAFRVWLEEVGASVEKLPAATFKDVQLLATTGANARLIEIEAPGSPAETVKDSLAVAETSSVQAGNTPEPSKPDPGKPEQPKEAKFSTTPEQPTQSVSVEKAKEIADMALSGLGLNGVVSIRAVTKASEAGVSAPEGVIPMGTTVDGRIFLFAENLADELAVFRTVFHELFHLGLSKTVSQGAYIQTMLGFLTDPQVRTYANRWKQTADGVSRKGTMPVNNWQALAVEEALSDIAEDMNADRDGTGTKYAALVGRMASRLASLADAAGLKAVAERIRAFTRTEAEQFVQAVMRRAGDAQQVKLRGQRFSQAPAAAENEDDANFGTKDRGEGSPADRAVMAMAGEGKSADDILRFIANASKSPFNRQVAQRLIATKANPSMSIGGDMGSADGYKNLAMYSRKDHEIQLAPEAAYKAEQIFLHEAIHSATLLALDKKSLFGVQMSKLYESVKEQGLAGEYGMKNVGEFVAEALSNKEFQKKLKEYKGTARDSSEMNLWERFITIVRKILGIGQEQHDALSRALELSGGLMRENMPLRKARSFSAEDAPAFAGVDQTATPEFKRWFGDSKVVDSAGKPLVVYHGTGADFAFFDAERVGKNYQWSKGFYFASSPNAASEYAMDMTGASPARAPIPGIFAGTPANAGSGGANIMPVHLSMQNPLVKRARGNLSPDQSADRNIEKWIAEAKAAGNDGLIVKAGNAFQYRGDVYIAFRPEQIKSATGNRGTFDPEDADIAHFGISDAASLKQSALDQIHKSMSHPGKVSVWDKTVGTMRNLAERSPAFKPVFESAQRFIDDMSMLANETADVAPRLLPRVESWRDLTKKPVSAEDNQAISKPLFEGTLMWARDTDGKPVLVDDMAKKYADLSPEKKAKMLMAAGRLDDRVLRMWQGLPEEQFNAIINSRFESQMLKAGVVWADGELKSLFNLNDQQISLYREARKAIDRSIDLTARADMLRAVGTEYGAMRDVVLEAPTLAGARDLLVDTLHADALEDESKADRLTALINTVGNRYESAVELIASGYAPLSRFGRYTVDVVDAAGERLYFGMSETVRDANQMADRMRAEFPGATVTQGTMSAEAYKLFAGITPESLELFGNMLGLDAEGGDARDKAFQEYLRLSKNNHSALKRLMHRKGIAGYSEDVGRVLASFTYSNARQAAGGLNAGTVEESINAIPKEQGELKDVAMGLRDYVRDPQEEGQAVRGMLFAQYLGGSVASAFVNMTQPVAVTLPWLSQYGGMKAAGAQLARAVKDMAGKATYEADLQTALGQAEEDGIVSPQEIHQLMAQARGAGTLRSGDGTRAGNARAAASNAWERTKVAWGQPFALAEQFNRRSTFIAAYRLAKERGMHAPAQFARRAVLETQFLYSKANKPKWARGAVGGTLFTFKTYSISYLELLNRMWTQGGPEGKRAVGWALATVMLMGGAGGLPFMEDLEDLIDGIAQLLGYNVSAKQWRRQALQDIVGKEMADFIDTGVSGLPGAPIDVSGRMGMGDLIPGTGMLLSKPDHSRDLMEVVGPAGDLVSRGFTGARKVLTGDVGGAALELAPSAVRNAAKGIDMAISDRYTDSKGYKVLDTTLPEAAAKFVGFQPRSVAKVQEANSFMMRSKAFYTQISAEIKAEWARALFEKDDGALQDVRDRLADWNRKNPEQQIVVKMPDVWKRVREMGKDRTQRIADTAPKALRQEMRNMARETG